MLENTVELVGGSCLIALPVVISFCIVGSIVVALRAIKPRKRRENEEGVNRDGSTRAQELERVV